MVLHLLMKIPAELVDNTIIVKKPRDIGRLYTKSNFGKTLTGNRLHLNLLEGVFLLGEGKITVFHEKKEIDFQNLIKIAARDIPEFEIKYLIFKDLRKRGYPLRLDKENKNIHFCIYKQKKNSKDKNQK